MIPCQKVEFNGLKIPMYTLNTVVIGSGAAGLNCVNRLYREMQETGVKNPQDQVALITRGMGLGTSHNSGSDKQTYYKMGQELDKAEDFAKTLTAGGCTNGDVAFIEGANSLRGFFRLADLGVPFPHNEKGGFVGYKTDHDPRQRGTSAGPWTSRFMVRKLTAEFKLYGITCFNHFHLLSIITDSKGEACGALCVDMAKQKDKNHGLVLFNVRNIVNGTGGPGDLYEISVYPKGQMGSYAAVLEAGARAHNLTESQFGLASLNPRWNLSGTYQQVIPRYFSTDQKGGDVQEFLTPWFEDMPTLATDIFLKGYQWPFDHDKVDNYGSSIIDIIVQNEMINKGRRVYMDFRENPRSTGKLKAFRLKEMHEEALVYLEKSGALQATPIERLAHMNQPSIDLYKEMGVDLWKEPLEIGICSQHCNGGVAVDAWWETTVPHLFVIGELAGTHGVKRPGGSALNAGQVGSMRAAQRIAHAYAQEPLAASKFEKLATAQLKRFTKVIDGVKTPGAKALDAAQLKKTIQHRMSEYGGMVRSLEGVRKAIADARAEFEALNKGGLKQKAAGYMLAAEVRELVIAQLAFLEAIHGILERGGGSRGSHLVTDPKGKKPHAALGDEWRFIPENMELRNEILGITYDVKTTQFKRSITLPNPAPAANECWFENTWAEYRKAEVFRKEKSDKMTPYEIYK